MPPPPSDKTKRRSLADDDNVDDDVDDDDADDAEEEDDDGEEEPQTDGGDDGGEYVDEEEVEIAIASGTPAAAATGQKAIPWGRKHIGHEPDDEDDELMMYAKVCTLSSALFFSLTLSDSNRIILTEFVSHTGTICLHGPRTARVSPTSRHRSAYQRRSGERRRRDLAVRRVQSGEDDNRPHTTRHDISHYIYFPSLSMFSFCIRYPPVSRTFLYINQALLLT